MSELPATLVTSLFRDVCPDGSVCAGERRGGGAHETSRREQQRCPRRGGDGCGDPGGATEQP